MSTTQQIYNGRYEIVRPIARGGMAEVFLAHDQLLDRPVALKVLFPELSVDKNFVERFRREAQNAANLSHPNIVSVYDWGEEGSTYFIVMEFVDGTSVAQQLRDNGPFSPDRAASIGRDVANALSFAHEHGVIHRDIKPANILINRAGQVKVTDFGIARARNTEDNLTQAGVVMGTATYFSPEQAQGLALDGRSDVYALGVVMYEMLTGKPPFSGDNPVTVATKHVNETPKTPRDIDDTISPALDAVVMTAMAKRPNDRYTNAAEMSADIDRFLQGRTVHAKTPVIDSGPATQAMPTPIARQRYRDAGSTAAMSQPTQMVRTRPPQNQKSDKFLVFLAIAMLLITGAMFGLYKYLSNKTDTVSVPALVGKTKTEAIQLLNQSGLNLKDTVTQSNAGDPDLVLNQTPNAGSNVKKHSGVSITISTRADVTVPSLIGKTQDQATSALTALGLNPQVQSSNSDQPQGTVLDQSPANGTKATAGDTVTITVSAGAQLVTVPDVTDLPESKATNKLGQAQLSYTEQHAFSSSIAQGSVISQDPVGGTQVKANASITLVISDGVGPITTISTSTSLATSTTH